MTEYENEPIRGLPGLLPAGEEILWQGAPAWQSLARSAFRTRLVAGYFLLLAAWALASAIVTDSGPVLAPMMMAKVDKRRRLVKIDALLASQFAGAPRIASADSITLYEEERVQAYFGGGYLYATPERQEPYL